MQTQTKIYIPMDTWFLIKKKKELHNWKILASSIHGAGVTGYACRRMQVDIYLSLWTKLNSKWIKVLSIKLHTLNLTEEKVGNSFELGTGEDFLNRTLILQTLRLTINKWDLNISIAGHWGRLFPNFLEIATLIPKVTVEACTPTSNEWKSVPVYPTSSPA